jgi:prepilin-type processing-associated H-X9-DG protein
VDGFSSSPVGHFTNLDLSLNHYRVRVDGLGGTNVVLGAQVLNRHSNGVNVAFTDFPGIALSDVTNVPLSIRAPVFAALAPDLLIWHMKEDGSEATHQRLIENEQWWSNSIPNCSVLYIGTPWLSLDTNSTTTLDQNTLVRSVALAYHRAYVDCMDPAVSYNWMLSQGYMVDQTHENVQGNQYLEHFAWDDVGFFGLGTPLRLSTAMVQGRLKVTFQTVTGILYTLESSGDLSTWQPMVTLQGDGNPITVVPSLANPRQYFRLRLQPGN